MTKESRLDLRCYCCGGVIKSSVALVTPTIKGDVHRVFVMLPRCAPKVDGTFELVRRQ